MRKKKGRIVAACILLLLFMATIGLALSMDKADKQKEDMTAFYTATIREVNIQDTGKRVFAEIVIEEYDTSLRISANISRHIGTDEVKDLKKGQKISFGVAEKKAEQIDKVAFVDIVSLRTESKNIFSIEDYNRCMHHALGPARVACVIVAGVSVSIALVCLLKKQRGKEDGAV